MSNGNVDWDTKLVIGQKAKAPKVAKNSADLNGASDTQQ
jgi:putative transcription factor